MQPFALCFLAALSSGSSGSDGTSLPEVGTDFPVYDELGAPSVLGDDVVYNPDRDEYFVVWSAGPSTPEVYALVLDAESGLDTGLGRIQLSTPRSGSSFLYNGAPKAAYDPDAEEYLVVWPATVEFDGVHVEQEILGQRVDAATGAERGADDFRISDMGSAPEVFGYADTPDVVYDAIAKEYLVVWSGTDDENGHSEFATEIFVQRIDGATGAELGTNDQRISTMGSSDMDDAYGAGSPSVAFNSSVEKYAVVWIGNDDDAGISFDDAGIFLQMLDGDGTEIAGDDLLISDPGVGGVTSVAYSVAYNTFLAVWTTDPYEASGNSVEGCFLGESGPIAPVLHGISDAVGTNANAVLQPRVAWDALRNEFLVAWVGYVGIEREILGQFVSPVVEDQVGENDFRISSVGPDEDVIYAALLPELAFDSQRSRFLAVFSGTLSPSDEGVFGQLLRSTVSFELQRNSATDPNSYAFVFGQTKPVIGATWDPSINHGAFVMDAVLDVVAVATQALEFRLAGPGTLLVDPTTLLVLAGATPGTAFQLAIPGDVALVGVGLTSQAYATNGAKGELTNAIDIVLGTY